MDWGKGSSSTPLAGTGIYPLDISGWNSDGASWGAAWPGSAMPFTCNGQATGFTCVFVLDDYVSVGNYLPIGMIQPSNGQFRVYKRPWNAL